MEYKGEIKSIIEGTDNQSRVWHRTLEIDNIDNFMSDLRKAFNIKFNMNKQQKNR